MDQHIERLKQMVLHHELPRTDFALMGVRCPYCGKSDQIRRLEDPAELAEILEEDQLEAIVGLWHKACSAAAPPAVWKFCQNMLKLTDTTTAEPL